MIEVVLKVLIAYLVGSVSGSLLLGRLRRVDIRTMGSGNPGGTNAFRTQGLRFAIGVVLIDVGKGLLAAGVVPWLPLPDGAGAVSGGELQMLCGFGAVVGHCYPAWHGFRGGKGAATTLGALLVIQPWLLPPMLVTWLVVLGLSGYVGLATILAAASLVPAAWWLDESPAMLAFVSALALFIAFTHRGNVRSMAAGTEYRFERARVRRWFR